MLVAPPPPAGVIVYDQIGFDGRGEVVAGEHADGTRRVLIMRNAYDPALSPDGRYVAAFQGRRIAIATMDGRVVRRIPSVGVGAFLTWSPDGRWLSYVAQHCPSLHGDALCGTLWVIRADGTGQRRASRESAVDIEHSFGRTFSWSPDSRRLVYAAFPGLVVSESLTGRRHLLGPSRRIKATPDWSPDGTRLLYADGESLVTSAPDGSDRRVVRGARTVVLAAWSHDGTRIAYVDQMFRVFVARPDGSQRVLLGRGTANRPLLWSPDGRWVLVGRAGDGRFEIFPADRQGPPRFIRGGEDGDWR